jgi:putative phage-type endonuclease
MLAGTIVETVQDRESWLETKQDYVGASEAAAVFGVGRDSAAVLYLRKLGLMPRVELTEEMEWGLEHEEAIARVYQRRTGATIVEQQLFIRHGNLPLCATLDAVRQDGVPVQFKCVSAWNQKELGEQGTDELPEEWLIQGHQEMLLADAARSEFAVLVGGNRLKLFTLPRNERIIEAIVEEVPRFWRDCVQARRPPIETAPNPKIMHLLYPGCSGEVELDRFVAEFVDSYEKAKLESRYWKDQAAYYRGLVLHHLGEHAIGRLPDGRVLTRRVLSQPAKTLERKAYDYTGLWISEPDGASE